MQIGETIVLAAVAMPDGRDAAGRRRGGGHRDAVPAATAGRSGGGNRGRDGARRRGRGAGEAAEDAGSRGRLRRGVAAPATPVRRRRWRAGRLVDRRTGQPRARARRHAPQRGFHGRRGARPSAGSLGRAKERFRGRIAEGRVPAAVAGAPARAQRPRVAVLCPQTYMNDAGRSVGPGARGVQAAARARAGRARRDRPSLRRGAYAARAAAWPGHNGLKSLKRELGGADFMRVRVGVGRPDSTDPEIVSAYVLGALRRGSRAGRASWSSGRRSRRASCSRRPPSSDEALRRVALALAAGADRGGRARPGGWRARAATRSSRGLLRPYMIAALAELDEPARARPTLVVVGDDRAARDLAGDLRAWLAPRRVRYYPSRGVAYESHLAPPPHLVGLRVAALDALLCGQGRRRGTRAAEQPVVVVSAVALSEKVPDPELRPHSFTLRVGELLDLDECAAELVEAGYERVDQVEERGQFAMRGGLLDVFPATEERAVRVDMFDVEIESLRWFSTFTQRSLGDVRRSRSHRPPSSRPSTASWRRSPPPRDPSGPATARMLRRGRTSRSSCRSSASERCWIWSGEETRADGGGRGGARAGAGGPLEGRVRGVRRRGRPPPVREPAEHPRRARRADADLAVGALRATRRSSCARSRLIRRRARSAEAEPELEKLVRSGYRTVVAFPRRGEGERAAYNLGRLKATWLGEDAGRRAGRCWNPRCASPPRRCARASSRRS